MSGFGQLAAAATREPIHRCNNRLRKGFDSVGHLMAGAHEMHHGIGWSGAQMFLERGDIGSSTERAAGFGDNDDTN